MSDILTFKTKQVITSVDICLFLFAFLHFLPLASRIYYADRNPSFLNSLIQDSKWRITTPTKNTQQDTDLSQLRPAENPVGAASNPSDITAASQRRNDNYKNNNIGGKLEIDTSHDEDGVSFESHPSSNSENGNNDINLVSGSADDNGGNVNADENSASDSASGNTTLHGYNTRSRLSHGYVLFAGNNGNSNVSGKDTEILRLRCAVVPEQRKHQKGIDYQLTQLLHYRTNESSGSNHGARGRERSGSNNNNNANKSRSRSKSKTKTKIAADNAEKRKEKEEEKDTGMNKNTSNIAAAIQNMIRMTNDCSNILSNNDDENDNNNNNGSNDNTSGRNKNNTNKKSDSLSNYHFRYSHPLHGYGGTSSYLFYYPRGCCHSHSHSNSTFTFSNNDNNTIKRSREWY